MLPRGLSMLWESTNPHTALDERFGFAGVADATNWVASTLAEAWAIRVTGCSRLTISDDNAIVWVDSDRGGLVIKWSRAQERFAALDASTRLLHAVAGQGVPVAAPIASIEGLHRVVLQGPSGLLSCAVLPELTGSWLDVHDRDAVLSAGATLARVHDALGQAHHTASGPTPPKHLISTWLDGSDRGSAPDASRRLAALLADTDDLDDAPQLVHNDFRSANILTRNSQVVGVLDFDEIVVGHRVADLAKACVYLGTLFRDWAPTPLAIQQTLRSGYESVRPLTRSETRWFELLVLWQGIIAIPEHDIAGWASAV